MSKLKEVYRAASPMEAGMIVALLNQHGIRAQTMGATLSFVGGEVPLGWPTAPQIVVMEEDEARARELVVEWESNSRSNAEPKGQDAESPKTWDCPECGEEVEYTFEMCWNCMFNRTAC